MQLVARSGVAPYGSNLGLFITQFAQKAGAFSAAGGVPPQVDNHGLFIAGDNSPFYPKAGTFSAADRQRTSAGR